MQQLRYLIMKFSTLAILLSASALAANNEQTETLVVYGKQYSRPLTIDEPAITNITNREIEEKQYSNLSEVVGSVTGAFVDSGARSGGERINIRGFDRPSDLAVFVDGAPIGFQQYRAGTFFFDPFLIGEVKVTKGAFDYKALNGKFGGTVHIKTKDIDDLLEQGEKFGTRFSVGYSDNEKKKSYGLSVFGKSDLGFYFLANGSFKNAGNVHLGDGTELEYSGFEQKNSLVKLGYIGQDSRFEVSNTHYTDFGRKPWTSRRGKMPDINQRKIRKYGSVENAKYAYTIDDRYSDDTYTITYNYNPDNNYLN
ncbi:TonB-dependent receptor plug domain-containing protein, partial [Vibrio mediterranei]|uniref:TonB-dependent receptor plug domain-containing protein n=1 Tax=Vibrio mediterranei TaxID=689 RepID=UPI001EFCA092